MEAHIDFATRSKVSGHFGNHFDLKLRFQINLGSSSGIPILTCSVWQQALSVAQSIVVTFKILRQLQNSDEVQILAFFKAS